MGPLAPGSGTADAYGAWAIATHLFASREIGTVLRRVVETARALTGAAGVAILLRDQERAVFVPAVPSVAVGLDERWLQRQGLDGAQLLALRAVDAGVPVQILDQASLPAVDLPLLQGGARPVALCVAPLIVEDRAVAVIEIFDAISRPTGYDLHAVHAFAALAGFAIVNAQVHERERMLRGRLEALDVASKALAAELSLEQVLQRIVSVAAQIVGARYAALGVAGEDGYLMQFVTTGLTPAEREKIGVLPRGHGLLGVLIRRGQPLRVPQIGKDPRRVGFPPHHPPMTSLLGVPIRTHNRIVGDLYLTDKIGGPEFSEDDQQLVELLAAHAGIAIENAHLYGQVGELTLLRERERISRDLHDGIIQDLYAATLQLEDISEDLPEGPVRVRLNNVADGLSTVITDVRTYIQGLRARALEGRPLAEAVAALGQETSLCGDLRVSFALEGEIYPVPDERATTILHIAREALSNVRRHAAATEVEVRLVYSREGVTLSIADDGQGFDPDAPRDESHRGLNNLRTRTEDAGGSLSIRSTTGAGTTITVFLPTHRALS